ncbi:MAG TPA: flagellar motor protein MotB [Bryobacteraceae bacterium]|nr:flagellar motor protein MotB [Bryobacteraceae bacterium]
MPTPIHQTIVIRKVKKSHGGHHGGAWKVAYADFVTAMMALFMVLWLVTSSEQVKKAIGGYFNDPTGKGKEVGNGLRGAGGESLAIQKDEMDKLKDKLEQAIKSSEPFQKINEHVVMMVTGEGLRVELLEDAKGMFFQSGSAEPTQYGKDLMALLAEEIGKLPNKVTVEGHTDSKPYTGRSEYSNWELSTDRANSARRWMMEHGMRPDQVTQVRGFADESPRNPANPADDSNRRVSFIIQYQPAPGEGGAVGATGVASRMGQVARAQGNSPAAPAR